MKVTNKIIIIFLVCFGFNSCETLDLNQLENPSGVPNELTDPSFAFNYVQLEFPDFINSANFFTQRVTRQMAMTGGNSYDNAFNSGDFNNNWVTGYNILSAIKAFEPKAVETNANLALGASKIIRCYILLTMVDMYGDIPVREALLGNENLTPNFDKGEEVYKIIFSELDEAISVVNKDNKVPINDLYYSGDKSKWITLAKTIKLKMLLTARNAGPDIGVPDVKVAMQAIISGGDIIDTPAEDFVFNYNNSRVNPNNRHPLYNDQYELGGGSYISNYMFWTMTTERDFSASPTPQLANGLVLGLLRMRVDPRVNYYFYKQRNDPASLDVFALPGRSRPAHYDDSKYSSFFDPSIKTPYTVSNWTGQTTIQSSGYLGRDHGNGDGIPPDADSRTVAGLYPIGGKFSNEGKSVQNSGVEGAKGDGILPILMCSFVHFMRAEAILTIGLSGDAKAELIAGITESMNRSTQKVGNYPDLAAPDLTVLANNKNFYYQYIDDLYDDLTPTKRLELIIKEYYIAAWGNGIEPYNNYRRTGYPSNFQPTLEPVSGPYFYRAYYPLISVSNNPNTPENSRTKRIFWDKSNLTLN